MESLILSGRFRPRASSSQSFCSAVPRSAARSKIRLRVSITELTMNTEYLDEVFTVRRFVGPLSAWPGHGKASVSGGVSQIDSTDLLFMLTPAFRLG